MIVSTWSYRECIKITRLKTRDRCIVNKCMVSFESFRKSLQVSLEIYERELSHQFGIQLRDASEGIPVEVDEALLQHVAFVTALAVM